MDVSALSDEFKLQVDAGLQSNGPALAVARLPNGAGARRYYLVESLTKVEDMISRLSPQTSVLIILGVKPHASGIIDANFIAHVEEIVPEDVELLLVYPNPRDDWKHAAEYASWRSSGTSASGIAELRGELQENIGEEVVILTYPDVHKECDAIIEAIVPYPDGRLIRATY